MMTPQELAQVVGQHILQNDQASKALGIQLLEVGPGYAKLQMAVEEKMLSGVGYGHGGVVFTLADSAFAYACNARNQKSLALSCNITFTTPIQVGDVITAIAEERALKGRTGLYDVRVTNQRGEDVAFFRASSYCVKVPLVIFE